MRKYSTVQAVSFILLLFSCSTKEVDPIRISIGGDLLLDRGVRNKIEYVGLSTLIDSSVYYHFDKQQIVIANLECPATKISAPINKKYIFRAEPEWLTYLKDVGITHLNLANNHSMDQGRGGLIDTWKNITSQGLLATGIGNNESEACGPLLLSASPRKVYLLSSVQVQSENWTYLPSAVNVCEEPFEAIQRRIKDLRSSDSKSVIIVQIHWGIEHQSKPTIDQKHQARTLIDAGADIIVGHHSHTIQSSEKYQGKKIFYGIGNFLFDQENDLNKFGLILDIMVYKDSIQTDTHRIHNYLFTKFSAN